MSSLQERLSAAIQLREARQLAEAHKVLLELQREFPSDPQVNYQCAWIHDALGLEREAIPFYEKAIQTGLSGDELKGAWLGMGSTYRCVGEYQKARKTFESALDQFPNSQEFKVFLGMTYYNIGEHAQAMELLLNALADTSQDEGIRRYQRAIRFYADKLDETW